MVKAKYCLKRVWAVKDGENVTVCSNPSENKPMTYKTEGKKEGMGTPGKKLVLFIGVLHSSNVYCSGHWPEAWAPWWCTWWYQVVTVRTHDDYIVLSYSWPSVPFLTYTTQSHYQYTERTSPCPLLWLGKSEKISIFQIIGFTQTAVWIHYLPHSENGNANWERTHLWEGRSPHLGHDEAVIGRRLGLLDGVLHRIEEEHRQDLCTRRAWCWVPAKEHTKVS